MLPPGAKAYFDTLWSSTSADAWSDLSKKQQEFEQVEFSKGRGPDGRGFAARLSVLYKESLSDQAQAIVNTLKLVHTSFNSPLDEDVDAQLLDWGANALSNAYAGLGSAFMRHLQGFGIRHVQASGLDHAYTLARVTVANLPRRYMWELRNVPSLRPQEPAAPASTQVTIHNSGTIGALQVGAGSTAYAEQQWIGGDTSELRTALVALREALEHSQDIKAEVRRKLIADISSAYSELEKERPNKEILLGWLGGAGAVIGTIGSLQPAYEAVRSVARLLGLPV